MNLKRLLNDPNLYLLLEEEDFQHLYKDFEKQPQYIGVSQHLSSWGWDKVSPEKIFWDFYGLFALWSWAGSGLEHYYGKSPDIYSPFAGKKGGFTSPYTPEKGVPTHSDVKYIDKMFQELLQTLCAALIRYLKKACILELQHFPGNSRFGYFIQELSPFQSTMTWETFVKVSKKRYPNADPEAILRIFNWLYHYTSGGNVSKALFNAVNVAHANQRDIDQAEKKKQDKEKADLQKWLDEPVDDSDLYDIEKEPKSIEEPPEGPEDFQDYPGNEDDVWVQDPDDPTYMMPRESLIAEVENVEGSSGMAKLQKITDAMKKANMTYDDVVEAYGHNIWNDKDNAFGGWAWGEGMKMALELERMLPENWKSAQKWPDKTIADVAFHIDKIYDLNHNTDKILNKSQYMVIDQNSLDRRAKINDYALLVPYVTEPVKVLLFRNLKRLGSDPSHVQWFEDIKKPSIAMTPEEKSKIESVLGFRDRSGMGTSMEGSYHWETIKRAGVKETVLKYDTPIIIKKHQDGSFTVHDKYLAFIKKADNVDEIITQVKNQFAHSLNKAGNKHETLSWELIQSQNNKIKLSPEQEAKLAQYQFQWRPENKRYKALALDGSNFYLYAFDNGKFMLCQKSTVGYKIIDSFDEALATVANVTFGKVKPPEGTAPSPSPSPSPTHTPNYNFPPPPPPPSNKKWGLSSEERIALKSLVATFTTPNKKWSVQMRDDGKYDVIMDGTPIITVGKLIDPTMKVGKPYIIHQWVGNKGETNNHYFRKWNQALEFISTHGDELSSKTPIPTGVLPPNKNNAMEYNEPGPPQPIRLTVEDEMKVTATGFVVKMGKSPFYQHEGTGDIVRFFGDNSAKFYFTFKKGSLANVTKKPIATAITFIQSVYHKDLKKSPTSGTPAEPSPILTGGAKAGGLFEPILKNAGFVWDQLSNTYEDLANQNSLWINKDDRSSKLTFSDKSVKQFPDLPQLIAYLKTTYKADALQKKSKPVVTMSDFEKLDKTLQNWGYGYAGIEGVNANEQTWYWKDPSGQTSIHLGMHGDVTYKHPALASDKHWGSVDDFISSFATEKQGKEDPNDKIVPLNEEEHAWVVGFFKSDATVQQFQSVTGNPSLTVVLIGHHPLVSIRKDSSNKYIVSHNPTEKSSSYKTEKWGFNTFEQVQNFLTNYYSLLLQGKPMTGVEDLYSLTKKKNSTHLTEAEKNWLINEAPKMNKTGGVIKPIKTVVGIKFYTDYNLLLFSVGKTKTGNYSLNRFLTNGSHKYSEYSNFSSLKSFIEKNIDELSTGEEIEQEQQPHYTTLEETKILTKAGFEYIGLSEDKLGDRFKHPIGSQITRWDDGKITYISKMDSPNAHQQGYANFTEFYGSVLSNKAYVYKNYLEGEQYTKHYYNDVAPDQNSYSIRLTKEDEERIKKHGFVWMPTSKTQSPNKYMRGDIIAIFYNMSVNQGKLAADIYNSDEHEPDSGKLGSFTTIENAIKYIEKNFPEEGGGGGGESIPPTTPSNDPQSLSESEWKALEALGKSYGLHADGTPKGLVIGKANMTKNEDLLYILVKDKNEYKFLWKPTPEKEWEPILAQYSLVKNDHITDFNEFYKYANEIFHNIASPDPLDKVLDKDTPSGETYKTEESAANAKRISLNSHDESLLAKYGFFWNDLDNSYTDDGDNKFAFTNDGKAHFHNAKEHLGKEHHTIPIALQWMIDHPDLSNYDKPKKEEPGKDLLAYGLFGKLPKGTVLQGNSHLDLLDKYGYNWKPSHELYYNEQMDRAIVIGTEGPPVSNFKPQMAVYFLDKQNNLKNKSFNDWDKLVSWLESEKQYFAGQDWAKQQHQTVQNWIQHDYDTLAKDKVQYVIKLEPQDEEKLKKIGFEFDDSQGYPVYKNSKTQEEIGFYNDDTAYYKDLNQSMYFYKDGGAKQGQDDWSKPAPIGKYKSGVHNAIASLIAWNNPDSESPEASKEGDSNLKLARDIAKHVNEYVAKQMAKYSSSNVSAKVYAIKALRQLFFDKTKKQASLLHAKTAIENWSPFLDYVANNGWPKMESASQGDMDVWLTATSDSVSDPDKDMSGVSEKLAEIGFEWDGDQGVDLYGAPIGVFKNDDGMTLSIESDNNVNLYSPKLDSDGNPTFLASYSSISEFIENWKANYPLDFLKGDDSKMESVGFKLVGMEPDAAGHPMRIFENENGDQLRVNYHGEVSYYTKIKDKYEWSGGWETIDDAIKSLEDGNIAQKQVLAPFDDGTPEDTIARQVGFVKSNVVKNVITYKHEDGTSVVVYPPDEDHNVPMQVVIYPPNKTNYTFAFQNPKETIAKFTDWIKTTYGDEVIGGEPTWEDLKKAIKDGGFGNPKKIKTIAGNPAVEYYSPYTTEYLVYLPDGSSYLSSKSSGLKKTFNKPEELLGFLKGDPKYTGKAWGGGEKPPFPTKLEKEYLGKSTQPIKLIGKDHQLMEDMGFDLTFSTNPIYSRGQMEVGFWSDDSAEVKVGGKPHKEFLSLNGGILTCLQWLYEEVWGKPYSKDPLPEAEQQIKAMGFKQFGPKTETGITYVKHDKKYSHTIDVKFHDMTMEYTRAQNKLPKSKILENWVLPLEKGIAKLQTKITSHIPISSFETKDATTLKLEKMGWVPAGKYNDGGYHYNKIVENEKGKFLHEIALFPNPHMIYTIERWDEKTQMWTPPIFKREWDDINHGLSKIDKLQQYVPISPDSAEAIDRLKKLGYKLVGSDHLSSWYTQEAHDPKHGLVHYQITLFKEDRMMYAVYMKNKNDSWVAMTTKEWDSIAEGLEEVESWSGGKTSTNEELLDYKMYPDPDKFYNPNSGGYKVGDKIKLRIKDHQAVLSKGFEWVSDPKSEEYNEYQHPNGDWFFIKANGLINLKIGSTQSGTTIKDGFSKLKAIYFKENTSTDEVPFSGYDYSNLWKAQGISKGTSIQLTEEDADTMKRMGFIMKHQGYNEFPTGYVYKKQGEWVVFYAGGHCSIYYRNNTNEKSFPTVKECMQFLWDKHSPDIKEGLKSNLSEITYGEYYDIISQLKSFGFQKKLQVNQEYYYFKDKGISIVVELSADGMSIVKLPRYSKEDDWRGSFNDGMNMIKKIIGSITKESSYKSFMMEWMQ